MASTEAPPTGRYEAAQPPPAEPVQPPAFPGCKPVHLPRAEIERFEGRLEYWDSATETAWISEPTTSYHERPSRLVTRADAAAFAAASEEVLLAAALACADEQAFNDLLVRHAD